MALNILSQAAFEQGDPEEGLRDRRRPSVGIRIRSRKPDLRGLLDRTQRCHDYLRSALSDLNICEKARAIRGTVRPPRSPSVPHDE
jgi:hypothetical protein